MLHLLAQTYTTYTTTTTSSDADAGVMAGLFAFLAAYLVVILVIAIVAIVGMWKMFEKAGRPGWIAIIPGYNSWTLAEMAGKPGWWGLVSFGGAIPFVGFIPAIAGFVLLVLVQIELTKRFGKSTGFAWLMVLLSPIAYCILGFGDAKYTEPANKPAAPTAAGPTAV